MELKTSDGWSDSTRVEPTPGLDHLDEATRAELDRSVI